MAICPNCGHELDLDERYNFCPACEEQFRCLGCGEMLVKGASRCLVCGQRLVNVEMSAQNSYSYVQTQNGQESSLRIKLDLTDQGMSEFGKVMGGQIPLGGSTKTVATPSVLLTEPAIPVSAKVHSEIGEKPEDPRQRDAESPDLDASQWFRAQKDGALVLQEKDLRGRLKKVQQERFVILFVWAYPQMNDNRLPQKEDILAGLRENGLYDQNVSHYFGEIAGSYLICTDQRYEPNRTGIEYVSTIVRDLGDSAMHGYAYWEKTTPRKRMKPLSDAAKSVIQKWVAQDSRGTAARFSALSTNRERCLYIVYDITRELQAATKVKPIVAYSYLKQRYETTTMTSRQFRDALRKGDGGGWENTSENEYYLTPKGEEEARPWFEENKNEA